MGAGQAACIPLLHQLISSVAEHDFSELKRWAASCGAAPGRGHLRLALGSTPSQLLLLRPPPPAHTTPRRRLQADYEYFGAAAEARPGVALQPAAELDSRELRFLSDFTQVGADPLCICAGGGLWRWRCGARDGCGGAACCR